MVVAFQEQEILTKMFWQWCCDNDIIFDYSKPDIDAELRCAVKAYSDHVLYEMIDYFTLDPEEVS